MSRLYLVTGAAGHLGSTIVKQLLVNNCKVRVFVLPNEQLSYDNVEVVRGNVCDRESLKPFFMNNNLDELIVIHCAGIVSITSKYSQKLFDVNVGGTKNVVDLCVENKVSKLVYVSSVHAIKENPKGEIIAETKVFNPDEVIGHYAKSKAMASAYALLAGSKGLNVTLVHPSGIIGPNDIGNNHLTSLITEFYNERLICGVKGGYDFVDVRDVAAGVIKASEVGRPNEAYILSNKYYSVKEILTYLHEITNKREVKFNIPLWFIRIVAPLAELYYKLAKKSPLFTAYSIYTLNSNSLFTHDKADSELSYHNRPIKETLSDTVDWLKKCKKI